MCTDSSMREHPLFCSRASVGRVADIRSIPEAASQCRHRRLFGNNPVPPWPADPARFPPWTASRTTSGIGSSRHLPWHRADGAVRFAEAVAAFREVRERAPDWIAGIINLAIATFHSGVGMDRDADLGERSRSAQKRLGREIRIT